MKYELETMREIWPDKGEGQRVEIGPDRDGLRLVEIRDVDCNDLVVSRITLTTEAALLVAKAIKLCADELQEQDVADAKKTPASLFTAR